MYVIKGCYSQNNYIETLDTADTKEEADRLKTEYQIAFGSDWQIWISKINRSVKV